MSLTNFLLGGLLIINSLNLLLNLIKTSIFINNETIPPIDKEIELKMYS